MIDLTVRGFWGPRAEEPEQLAERWLALLGRLEELDGELFSTWVVGADSFDQASPVERSVPDLAALLRAGNDPRDAPVYGYLLTLMSRAPSGLAASVQVTGGAVTEYAANSVLVELYAEDLEEYQAPQVAKAPGMLAALADAWDVDQGEVTDEDLLDALDDTFDLANSDPRAGRAVYLSAGRWERLPQDPPGRATPTAHGGVVLDLTGPSGEVSTHAVLDAHRVLVDCGALAPRPTPMTRPQL
ncbi:Imm52 family immunity protein [Streptomyces sp. NPDC005438]|uniref:Imm52 family immunity protein n=1 Tax=Streptomyces sp. NPDC005438 TaxID=3156880 RepID=UPI0033A5C62B